MTRRQRFCRGEVVLHSGKASLIVAVLQSGVVLAPLRAACVPAHRADVTVPPIIGADATTVSCAELSRARVSQIMWLGNGNRLRLSNSDMARVDAAIKREIAARVCEELPPGIMKSTCRPFFGSRGRKVGGAPSD